MDTVPEASRRRRPPTEDDLDALAAVLARLLISAARHEGPPRRRVDFSSFPGDGRARKPHDGRAAASEAER